MASISPIRPVVAPRLPVKAAAPAKVAAPAKAVAPAKAQQETEKFNWRRVGYSLAGVVAGTIVGPKGDLVFLGASQVAGAIIGSLYATKKGTKRSVGEMAAGAFGGAVGAIAGSVGCYAISSFLAIHGIVPGVAAVSTIVLTPVLGLTGAVVGTSLGEKIKAHISAK